MLSSFLLVGGLAALVGAAPADNAHLLHKRVNAYAPITTTCPSTPLVRPASGGIGASEQAYFTARKAKADPALKAWLTKVGFTAAPKKYPSVGLTVSGGGYRSMLEGAGVIQGLDSRDSKLSTAGLYQALTYQAGLSGGAFLLGSVAGNNWPTISSLQTGLWNSALNAGIIAPGGGLATIFNDAQILADIDAKDDAGFTPTLTDPWGRLLSYQIFYGSDGGVSKRLSTITSQSQFTSNSVPYPIITAIETSADQCVPTNSNPQFELHPYEFGSWDSGIAAFTQSAYLGSKLQNGSPTTAGKCIQNFDNLGYVVGTSSTLFSEICVPANALPSLDLLGILETFIEESLIADERAEFAVYPNPFYKYTVSSAVQTQTELHLVDGGESNQNNPIWPFIQNARTGVIDVLLVNDNSADTSDNWPNGTEIYNTYLQAQAKGLTRMPVIPPPSTFVSRGLNKKAVFFGCNDSSKLTIVWLPNTKYTYDSNKSSLQDNYTPAEITGMLSNGNAIATQNGAANWPQCLSCAVMQKSGATLPAACTACFSQYCFTG
jgi:lysophospholipase